jgi:TP901 family phage tail tape measure protein
MGLLGEMTVKINGDVSGLAQAGQQASGILSNLADGNFAGALTDSFMLIGKAAIGFGSSSVSAAADFQQSMLKVQAYAGMTQQQADSMSSSIKDMATQVGQSPKALADAIYPIVSAGYQSADALNILKLSAETAASSGAQTSVVADALTTSLKAMHAPASQAGAYMDMLNKTVSLGKGEMPQYAAVIGKLALSAGSANVPFGDMDAALATLTTHGFPSVAQASTSLGNLFTQIGPKVDQIKQRADKLGVSFDENAFKSMSLADKLSYLKQQTNGSDGEMLKLLGGNKSALQSFDALENSVGDFTSNLKAMGKASGTTAQVFATASQGYNASIARISASFDVLKINIGSALLPIITNLLNSVAPLIAQFGEWMTKSNTLKDTFSAFSPIIANVVGMVKVMAANWAGASSSFSPLIGTLKSFGQLLGNMLPGFISQFLRSFNNINMIVVSVASGLSTIAVPAIKIFGQVLMGAQSAAEPIINAVEGQLVPALQNLIGVIAPVIAGILQWVANSGMLPGIMSAIGTTVTVVVNVLSGLINGLASVINFFANTELGGAILKATLITLGIVLGIIAAVVIPPLIAGLIAMGIAAVATGIEMLVAFAPIIIPILAIIAIVTAVILIVQHWGDIAHWLQGVWAGALAGIKNIWSGITAFFDGLWKGVQKVFGNVGGWFHDQFAGAQKGVQSGWDNTKTFFKGVGDNIQNTWKTTTENTVKAFQWLYDHNYYFKNLCDNITKFVSGLEKWLQTTWSGITSFASTQWNRLVGFASSLWNKLVLTIRVYVAAAVVWLQGQWSQVVNFVSSKWSWLVGQAQSIWNNIFNTVSSLASRAGQFLQDKWNQLSSFASDAWGKVSTVFSNAWGTYIAGPLNSLWGQITGFWNNTVIGGAAALGSQLMTAIANGISGAAGAVGGAIHNAIGSGLSALGFHDIPGFATGVQNFGGGLAIVGEKGPELIALPSGSNVYNNADTQAMLSRSATSPTVQASSANNTASNNQPVNITIMLDGRIIGRGVAPHIVDDIRVKTGLRAA